MCICTRITCVCGLVKSNDIPINDCCGKNGDHVGSLQETNCKFTHDGKLRTRGKEDSWAKMQISELTRPKKLP